MVSDEVSHTLAVRCQLEIQSSEDLTGLDSHDGYSCVWQLMKVVGSELSWNCKLQHLRPTSVCGLGFPWHSRLISRWSVQRASVPQYLGNKRQVSYDLDSEVTWHLFCHILVFKK